MKNSENNLKCRLATHGDYSQVMSIDHNIYGGYDYLDHLYHSYLEKESLICSVGELNGKIVSGVGPGCLYTCKSTTIQQLFHEKNYLLIYNFAPNFSFKFYFCLSCKTCNSNCQIHFNVNSNLKPFISSCFFIWIRLHSSVQP